MKKIDCRVSDPFLPIVSKQLGECFNWCTRRTIKNDHPPLFNLRLIAVFDDCGKINEMICADQNDLFQVRMYYDFHSRNYVVAKYDRRLKKVVEKKTAKIHLKLKRKKAQYFAFLAFPDSRQYTFKRFRKRKRLYGMKKKKIIAAECLFHQYSQEIFNKCFMECDNLQGLERMKSAFLVQAYIDYWNAIKRNRKIKKELAEDKIKPKFTKRQLCLKENSLKRNKIIMGKVWFELHDINPDYVKHLRKLKSTRFQKVQDILNEVM